MKDIFVNQIRIILSIIAGSDGILFMLFQIIFVFEFGEVLID
jgi:hypothetical protein